MHFNLIPFYCPRGPIMGDGEPLARWQTRELARWRDEDEQREPAAVPA